MNTSYSCGVCSKIVAKNRNAVCCDKCDIWVHMVCSNLSKYCYRKLQKDNSPWLCVDCLKKEMAFSDLSDNQLKIFVSGKTIFSPNMVEENQIDQLVPQEFGAAVKNNLYIPLKKSMILKFLKILIIFKVSYIFVLNSLQQSLAKEARWVIFTKS